MKFGRIYAVAERLMRQLLRDRRMSVLIFVVPMVLMALLAVLLGSKGTPPKVAIQAGGTASLFLSELEMLLEEPDEEGEGFELIDLPEGMAPEDAVRKGIVDAVMVVPDKFLEERASGKRSHMDLIIEGANPMRSADIFSRFRKAVPDSLGGLPKFLPADCDPHCADTIADGPPKIEMLKIYGQDIDESMDFFTPVLPPFFAFFFIFILSGMAFLRERVGGTAERLLASPLSRAELVTGYILGFLPAALIQATVVILFAAFFLGGPWGGWPVIIAVLLLALVAECLGVFISAFARTEFQVFQFIPIVIVPQLLLCGIVWPLETLPEWLRVIAYCMPVTYAVEAIRDVAVRGFGFLEVWHDLAALLGYAVLTASLAALSVRRSV